MISFGLEGFGHTMYTSYTAHPDTFCMLMSYATDILGRSRAREKWNMRRDLNDCAGKSIDFKDFFSKIDTGMKSKYGVDNFIRRMTLDGYSNKDNQETVSYFLLFSPVMLTAFSQEEGIYNNCLEQSSSHRVRNAGG